MKNQILLLTMLLISGLTSCENNAWLIKNKKAA